MKKALCIFGVLTFFVLSSCGGTSSSVDSNSTSTSSNNTSSSSVNTPPPTFSKSQFGVLYGEFYGTQSTLTIDEKGTYLSTGLSLVPTKIQNENFKVGLIFKERLCIYYDEPYNDANYRIRLSSDSKMTVVLEKYVVDNYVEIENFMPSINEFNGSYTWDGSSDEYNVVYNFGNYYDSIQNVFITSTRMYGVNETEYYYVKSSFVELGDEIKKIISLYDYPDDYLYYDLYLVTDDGVNSLFDISDSSFAQFVQDPIFLNFDSFNDEGELTFTFDKNSKSVKIGDSDSLTIEEITNEDGYFAKTTYLEKETLLQSTPYGIKMIVGEEEKHYVWNDISKLIGNYSYYDIHYSFDGSTLLINEKENDFEYVVNDYYKSIKTLIDGETYIFTPFKSNVSLKVVHSDAVDYFINKEQFVEYFNKKFISKNYNEENELIIDDNFNVTFNGKKTNGELIYSLTEPYPFVKFNIDNKEYEYRILQVNIGAYTLTCDDVISYYFDNETVLKTYDVYTMKYQSDITLTNEKLVYFGKEYDYAIFPYYVEDYFVYTFNIEFSVDGKIHQLEFGLNGLVNDYEINSNERSFINSFIPLESFKSLIGTYSYLGRFGVESFTITEDGHFYADTVNETGDGLIKDVEYDYYLTLMTLNDGSSVVTLAFQYTDSLIVYLYKDGPSLVTFNLKYVVDYIFDYIGVYADTTIENVFELRNDTVYINGDSFTIDSYENNDGKVTLNVSNITNKYQIELSSNGESNKNVVIKNNDETLFSANNIEFNMETYVGDYVKDDVTAKIYYYRNVDELQEGYVVEINGTKYDYTVVAHNGVIAIKVSVLFDVYYFYVLDGKLTLDKEGGSLPPPPPPPAL